MHSQPIQTYEVVHERVYVRAEPSASGKALGVLSKGRRVDGRVSEIARAPWLRLEQSSLAENKIKAEGGAAYMLVNGKSVGLGELLRPVKTFKPNPVAIWDKHNSTAAPSSDSPKPRVTGKLGEYSVVQPKVVVRREPLTTSPILAVHVRGDGVSGTPHDVNGVPWLLVAGGAWMLMDGKSVGLGKLLEPRVSGTMSFEERQRSFREKAAERHEAEVAEVADQDKSPEQVAAELWGGGAVPLWLPWVPAARRGLGLQRTGASAAALQWMSKKTALKQDLFLLGPPGSTCRMLALQFCAMTNQEAMYVHIARDTNESDLKQRREISGGTLSYMNAAPVESAVNGRVLIIEGVEKAERNVLPLLNNLLENREMALESGDFLTPRHVPGSGTLPVQSSFLVIAIGLPVPRYAGTPLDPPLRSRFAAFNVNSLTFYEEMQALQEIAPDRPREELSRLVSTAARLRKEGLPRFPEESLQAVARILQLFRISLPGVVFRLAYPEALLPLTESGRQEVDQIMSEVPVPAVLNEALVQQVLASEVELSERLCRVKIALPGGFAGDIASAPCGHLPLDSDALHRLPVQQGSALAKLMMGHCAMQDLVLIGERGVGKTHVVRTFAKLLGYRIRTVFCFKDMAARELLTRRSTDSEGNTEWRWGPLLQAAVHGDICVLDGIHRLPRGLLSAAAGRLASDRSLDLPDGRLVPPEQYYALLRSGHTQGELQEKNIHPVHPAFRIICTAEPPERIGAMDWLSDEILALFLFVGLAPLSDDEHRSMLASALQRTSVDGLLNLSASFRNAAAKEPARYRPLKLSTRRLLQVGRYAAAGEEGEALARTLRPPFALLPETAQQTVVAMLSQAKQHGLPTVELKVKVNAEDDAATARRQVAAVSEDKARALAKAAVTKGGAALIAEEKKRVNDALAAAVTQQRAAWERAALQAVHDVASKKTGGTKQPLDVAVVQNGELRIGDIKAAVMSPKNPELVPKAPFVETPQHQEVLRQMLLDWTIGHHMLLIGPQGVGKNKLADRLLELLQCEREYIQLHRDSTVSSLVSTPSLIGGALVWGDSPLVKALKYGRVLVIDEADKAPLEVVCVLKALVEDGEYALPDGRLVTRRAQAGDRDVIVPNEHFRAIVLANRPGYPFLGNNFYSECGDVFAALVVEAPDLASEAMLVQSYGPRVEPNIVARLLSLFAELKLRVEEGVIIYPYSTRELVKIVQHLEAFRDEKLDYACRDIFAFDLQDGSGVLDLLLKTTLAHKIQLLREEPTKTNPRQLSVLQGRLKEALSKQGSGLNQRVAEEEEELHELAEEARKLRERRKGRFLPERIGELGAQSKEWGMPLEGSAPFSGGHGFGVVCGLQVLTPSEEAEAVSTVLTASDHYAALGAARNAEAAELQRLYLQTAVRVHPAVNRHADARGAFSRAAEVLALLSNKEARKAYDAHLLENDLLGTRSQVKSEDAGSNGSCCKRMISKMTMEDGFAAFAQSTELCSKSVLSFSHTLKKAEELLGTGGNKLASWDTACLCQWIFTQYDADKDGYLNLKEAQMWTSDTGNELEEDIWEALCEQVGCDPSNGLSMDGFRKVYTELGVGDINADYWCIRDLHGDALEVLSAVLAAADDYAALSASQELPLPELRKCYLWVAVRVHPLKNGGVDASKAFMRVAEAWTSICQKCGQHKDAFQISSEEDAWACFVGAVAESTTIGGQCIHSFDSTISKARELLQARYSQYTNVADSWNKLGMCDWMFQYFDADGDGFLNLEEAKQFFSASGSCLDDEFWLELNTQLGCDASCGVTKHGLQTMYMEVGLGDITEDYWSSRVSAEKQKSTGVANTSEAAVTAVLSKSDPYAVLEALRDLPSAELRRCFLWTAVRVHPQANSHPEAGEAFRRVAEAWSLVSGDEVRIAAEVERFGLVVPAKQEPSRVSSLEESSFENAMQTFLKAVAQPAGVASQGTDIPTETMLKAKQLAELERRRAQNRALWQEQFAQAQWEKTEMGSQYSQLQTSALQALLAGGHSSAASDRFKKFSEYSSKYVPGPVSTSPGLPLSLWVPWVPEPRRGVGLRKTCANADVLQWMAKKTALKQDLFLLGPPGSLCRTLALQFCAMTNQEAMYIHIARDTNESDLKQRREISNGTLEYVNAAPVEAATNGRVLILEGVEKAERNVLPLLNNLLENREMALESGDFLTPRRLPGSNTLLVRPGFLVIAIGLPVPRYAGTPLDPPLRSRFAAFSVEQLDVEDEFNVLREVAPDVDVKVLNQAIQVAKRLRREGLPRLAEESLQAVARLLQIFPNCMTLGSALRLAYPETLLAVEETAAEDISKVFKNLKEATSATVLDVASTSVERLESLCRLRVVSAAGLADIVSAACGKLALDLTAFGVPRGTQRTSCLEMLQCHCAMQDIMLMGERGVGKTYVIRAFAHLLGYQVRTLFCFKDMTTRELITRRSTDAEGNTEWQWGPLLHAAVNGDIAVLDGIHRLPRGLLVAAVGRLVADRTMDLPDGRLVSPQHYHALLRSGRSEEDLRKEKIHPVHPAFRLICTAEPPDRDGPMAWLTDEILSLFMFVPVQPMSDFDHRQIIGKSIDKKPLDGLLFLRAELRAASKKEPAIYRPLQLSTRRLLQIKSYVQGGTSLSDALGRVLRPAFALLSESAQEKVQLIVADAVKKGLPRLQLSLRQSMEAAVAASKIKGMTEELKEQLHQEAIGMVFGMGDPKLIHEERVKHGQEQAAAKRDQRAQRFKDAKAAVEVLKKGRPPGQEAAEVIDGLLRIGNIRTPVLNPRRPELVPEAPFVEIPQHQEVLREMLLDWTIGHHMLLIGPQGVGKNKLADRLLELLRGEREYTQLHRDSTVSSLVSAPSLVGGTVVWGDSPLVRALKFGRILVLDEADKAPLEVVCVLKALVEDGEYALPDGRLITKRGRVEDPGVIVPADGFRVIVLANRPGFPFLGNDFFSECGDVFAAMVVESPDLQSEAMLLRSYGPSVEDETLARLLSLFAELRLRVEEGALLYPYSTRELVKIVRHLETFPDDEMENACNDVFAFDLQEGSGVADLLKKAAQSHKIEIADRLRHKTKKVLSRIEQSMKVSLRRRAPKLASSPKASKQAGKARSGDKRGQASQEDSDEDDYDDSEEEGDDEDWDQDDEEWWEEGAEEEEAEEIEDDWEQEQEPEYSPSRKSRLKASRIGNIGAQSKGWGFNVGKEKPFTSGFGVNSGQQAEAEPGRLRSTMSPSERQREEAAIVSSVLGATDHYAALQVDRMAHKVKIQSAYLRTALRVHPERNRHPDGNAAFIRATEAWLVLGDDKARREYDVTLFAITDGSHAAEAASAESRTAPTLKEALAVFRDMVIDTAQAVGEGTLAGDSSVELEPLFRAQRLVQRQLRREEEEAAVDSVMSATDHYSAINVSPKASLPEIREGYLKAAVRVHPRKNRHLYAEVAFLRVASAWDVLSEAEARLDYDLQLQAITNGEDVELPATSEKEITMKEALASFKDAVVQASGQTDQLAGEAAGDASAGGGLRDNSSGTNGPSIDNGHTGTAKIQSKASTLEEAGSLVQQEEHGPSKQELKELTEDERAMCDWIFDRYDADVDGYLNLKEVRQMTKDTGDEIEDDMWPIFAEQVKCDPDQGISREALHDFYKMPPEGHLKEDYEKLQQLAKLEADPDAAAVAAVLAAKDHYAVISARKNMTTAELRKCYLKTSLRVHPDKNGHPDAKAAFQRVADAWAVLSDPEEKRRYDDHLNGGSAADDFRGPERSADAFATFAQAAKKAAAAKGGNDESNFNDVLHQAQNLAQARRRAQGQQELERRPVAEEQKEQARNEMLANGDGDADALLGLLAGGHSSKEKDEIRRELVKRSEEQAKKDKATGDAEASGGGQQGGESGGQSGSQAGGQSGASKGSQLQPGGAGGQAGGQAGGNLGQKGGKASGKGKGKGKGKRGGRGGAAGGAGGGGAEEGEEGEAGVAQEDQRGNAQAGSTPQASASKGGQSGRGRGGRGPGQGTGGGHGKSGSGGTGGGGGDGKKGGQSGGGGRGGGGAATGGTKVKKEFDPTAKVLREAEKNKISQELNVYDLFEEEPLPDMSAPRLNYAEESTYDTLKKAVAAQVAQMREMLRNHEAKEREREWKRGLPDGELDDMRLVEAACGDQNVFRRRQDSKNAALLASKPKRILIACDLSPSMSVLDRVDDRLRRMQEALVFIMESLSGFGQKYDYMVSGYSSAGYDLVYIPWTRPPRTSKQRLQVLEKMVGDARRNPPGDGTLAATEWAIKEVRKREGDEYFCFIISDAELQRHAIEPSEWNKLLMADTQVNAYAIIISMSSNETRMFLDGIDKGHGFACEQRDELAGIFKKVFSETLTKEK